MYSKEKLRLVTAFGMAYQIAEKYGIMVEYAHS